MPAKSHQKLKKAESASCEKKQKQMTQEPLKLKTFLTGRIKRGHPHGGQGTTVLHNLQVSIGPSLHL